MISSPISRDTSTITPGMHFGYSKRLNNVVPGYENTYRFMNIAIHGLIVVIALINIGLRIVQGINNMISIEYCSLHCSMALEAELLPIF